MTNAERTERARSDLLAAIHGLVTANVDFVDNPTARIDVITAQTRVATALQAFEDACTQVAATAAAT